MSILAIDKTSEKKAFVITAAASVFCMIFTYVYYKFSHEVYSDYLSYMFLIPLVFGTLFYGVMTLCKSIPKLNRIAFNIYNSGIATLTVACMLKGILNIAMATSPYVIYFFIVGIAMLLVGLLIFAIQCIKA